MRCSRGGGRAGTIVEGTDILQGLPPDLFAIANSTAGISLVIDGNGAHARWGRAVSRAVRCCQQRHIQNLTIADAAAVGGAGGADGGGGGAGLGGGLFVPATARSRSTMWPSATTAPSAGPADDGALFGSDGGPRHGLQPVTAAAAAEWAVPVVPGCTYGGGGGGDRRNGDGRRERAFGNPGIVVGAHRRRWWFWLRFTGGGGGLSGGGGGGGPAPFGSGGGGGDRRPGCNHRRPRTWRRRRHRWWRWRRPVRRWNGRVRRWWWWRRAVRRQRAVRRRRRRRLPGRHRGIRRRQRRRLGRWRRWRPRRRRRCLRPARRTLLIEGGTLGSGGVQGGAGGAAGFSGAAGGAGDAFGGGLFIGGYQQITLAPKAGETLTIAGVIADATGSLPTASAQGAGGLIVNGPGTVVLEAINTYVGDTTIGTGGVGGTLELQGTGSILHSRVDIADGVFDISAAAGPEHIAGLSGGGTIALGSQHAAGRWPGELGRDDHRRRRDRRWLRRHAQPRPGDAARGSVLRLRGHRRDHRGGDDGDAQRVQSRRPARHHLGEPRRYRRQRHELQRRRADAEQRQRRHARDAEHRRAAHRRRLPGGERRQRRHRHQRRCPELRHGDGRGGAEPGHRRVRRHPRGRQLHDRSEPGRSSKAPTPSTACPPICSRSPTAMRAFPSSSTATAKRWTAPICTAALFVGFGGNVTIENLTIASATAIGGAGGAGGGGGGAGLGGGLFVGQGGAVTLDNVGFANNGAIGGAGGLGAINAHGDFVEAIQGDGGGGGGLGGAGGAGRGYTGWGGGGGGVGAGAAGGSYSYVYGTWARPAVWRAGHPARRPPGGEHRRRPWRGRTAAAGPASTPTSAAAGGGAGGQDGVAYTGPNGQRRQWRLRRRWRRRHTVGGHGGFGGGGGAGLLCRRQRRLRRRRRGGLFAGYGGLRRRFGRGKRRRRRRRRSGPAAIFSSRAAASLLDRGRHASGAGSVQGGVGGGAGLERRRRRRGQRVRQRPVHPGQPDRSRSRPWRARHSPSAGVIADQTGSAFPVSAPRRLQRRQRWADRGRPRRRAAAGRQHLPDRRPSRMTARSNCIGTGGDQPILAGDDRCGRVRHLGRVGDASMSPTSAAAAAAAGRLRSAPTPSLTERKLRRYDHRQRRDRRRLRRALDLSAATLRPCRLAFDGTGEHIDRRSRRR